MAKLKFKKGCVVRVIAAYDETLPKRFIGRLGVIASDPEYQGVGDDPKKDPFWEVQHAPGHGFKVRRQFYWTDELELVK